MDTILNLVTNRSNNFQNPVLNFNSGYRPHRETPEETAIRTLLKLRVGDPDYFTVGVLQAINAFPEVKKSFPKEGVETYDLTKWRKPATLTEYGKLVPTKNGPPWVKRVVDSWPVETEIELKYVTSDAGLVKCGSFSQIVEVRPLLDEEGSQLVYLTWPEQLAINGTVKFNSGGWTTGAVFRIRHTPANFPYTALTQVPQASVEKNKLLVSQGLMAQYFSAQFATEKVAILGLALALSTNSHG
jgi:hypothetical protein